MKPITNTAFYCCGVRMQDSQGASPVCNDTYARRLLGEEGEKLFSLFQSETRANASNVTRHRVIDDIVKQALARNPGLTIILIGAGLDSRAYRMQGGNWIELDEPQIIQHKNERLPIAECSNPLQRIPIDHDRETLEEKLRKFATNEKVLVIIEGVFMYLHRETIKTTLATLSRLFPKHDLVCDLMTKGFFEKYSATLHQKLGDMGAEFRFTAKRPHDIFAISRYRLVNRVSVISKAVEYGLIKLPKPFPYLFMRTLRNGFTVNVFRQE